MAIGLGLLFNIKLPINFNSPYKARNIQEFWKKWHITLGRFLTQYIYIPFGGNRKGSLRTYFNVFMVFFISGFWHGAGWTFILWGILHGLASIVVRLWSNTKIQLPYWLSWFLTFQFVNVAWVYFRSDNIHQANVILKKMVTPNWNELFTFLSHPIRHFVNSASYQIGTISLNNSKLVILVLIVICVFSFFMKNSAERLETFKPKWSHIFICQIFLFCVLYSVFIFQKNSVFLYFNF